MVIVRVEDNESILFIFNFFLNLGLGVAWYHMWLSQVMITWLYITKDIKDSRTMILSYISMML